MQLQIHLVQRLLHVVHVCRRHLHQALPMPQQRSHRADFLRRPIGGPQQTHRMQELQPLAVAKRRSAGRARSSHAARSPGTPRSRAPPESGTEESSTRRLTPSPPSSIPQCFSQSAKQYRSCVKVGKERTFSAARSGGTATKISVAPISIPAASGRITGSAAWLICSQLCASSAPSPPLSVEDDGPSRAKRVLS